MDWNEKLVDVVQKIFWPCVGVGIVALVVSYGWSYKKSLAMDKLEKTQDELFVIRQEVNKATEAITPKDDPKKDPKSAPMEKPKIAADVQEKAYAEVVKKLQAFIQANQGTQPAIEAGLLVSELTQDYNREVAITSLTQALQNFPKEQFLFGVGNAELGNLYAKEQKCEEAAQTWEKVFIVKEHSYLDGNLRLKAAVCYEKKNQLDKAEKLYQEVVDKEPTSFSGKTAKKFLLHLKYLKSKAVAGL